MSDPDWLRAERGYEDEVTGDDTLARMFEASADRNRLQTAQRFKGGIYDRSLSHVLPSPAAGEYASVTYDEMRDIVRNLAAGFRDLGVESDDRVGIFADTRMEWAQSDFALLAAGAIVTTVYTESSPEQVEYFLDDPDATGVVVENEELLERVLAVEDDLDLEFVVVMDEYDSVGDREDVYTLGELHDRGAEAFDLAAYEIWLDDCDLDDLASLIYTSGTTGKPKGVKLTHRNVRANVNQVRKRFGPRPDKDPDLPTLGDDGVSLSFLPLAHVFERLAGHFVAFASGATVAYAESTDTVAEDIKRVSPSTAASVPRVYERIYNSMREEAGEGVRASIFSWAVEVAREYAAADDPGLSLRAKHAVADALVYSSVREELGGEVEFFVSGGGSLSRDLSLLFEGMGLTILEGYGLTETSPVISTNPAEDSRPGTLGPPVVGVDVELDGSVVASDLEPERGGELGELLVKGPNVFEGYWNHPEATEEAFTDAVPANGGSDDGASSGGWFRTGDIIEQTPDGYLVYRERLKQLLVLDTGKNVAPQPIEDEFATSDRIEQMMVVGDNRKFIAALVVPDRESVRRWADREGVDLPDSAEGICADERVHDWIGGEVERINERFGKHEQIKEFRLVPMEWTADNDLLTPSMKKKRRNIAAAFEDEIEDIYAGGDD